jgi:AbrB family looped-hinge helix DNA binding protein
LERTVRVTSKGQVTIPIALREKANIHPQTEIEFSYQRDGSLRLARSTKRGKRKTRGESIVEHLLEFGRKHPIKMTTDEIMALTRGED